MRTKVFTYKGYIGIESNVKAEGLLNDPKKKGQLGFVVNAEFVDIQPKALTLLKKIKTSADDIGDVDVFKDSKGRVVFSWLCGPLKGFKPSGVTGSNTYDASLLKSNKDIAPSDVFVKVVDGWLKKK